MKQITYNAQLWIDLSEELRDKEVQSFSLGYDGKLYVLTTYKKDAVKLVIEDHGWFKVQTEIPHDVVVYVATSEKTERYVIPNQTWKFNRVQPLPNEELLLVCTNVDDDEYDEKNAQVYTLGGTFRREFALGDDISNIRTTNTGDIWVSYIDRAIWEPPGMKEGDPGFPIGANGLNKFNVQGIRTYQYEPIDTLHHMFDCYVVNIGTNASVWIYYYDDFPLVKIVNDRIIDYWHPPIYGSRYLAIHNNHVVFVGSYDDKLFHHYELLPDHKIEHMQTFDIEQKGRYTTRGKTIVICEDNQFYRFDIPELLRHKNRIKKHE